MIEDSLVACKVLHDDTDKFVKKYFIKTKIFLKELWSKLRKLKNNITREKNDKKLTVKNYTNIKYKDVSIFHEENILMSFCLTATLKSCLT